MAARANPQKEHSPRSSITHGRRVKATLFAAEFAEEFDAGEDAGLICADAALCVGLREEGEQIAACGLADEECRSLRVGPVD